MAKRERIALTDEERAERRKQERELTERAVAQLRSSAGWQRWLEVRAQDDINDTPVPAKRSLGNQLLVAL